MEDTKLAALIIVVILIAIDYITGLMKAAMQHDISSEKMRLGLWHKSVNAWITALQHKRIRSKGLIRLACFLE